MSRRATAAGRHYPRRPRAKPRGPRLARILLALTGLVVLLAVVGVAGAAAVSWVVYDRNATGLGDINALLNQNFGPAKIYDRTGKLLYEFEDRQQGLHEKVALKQVSPWVVRATVATEDASFYSNRGINVRGLIRAAVENVVPGRGGLFQGSGGSSITQQLVKNVLIPEEDRYERNVDRKVREAVLAVEITRRYSKDQILEWYLNEISYGNRAYGIAAAAQRYFGVPPAQLTLAQASLLAGIPQQPVAYDPLLYFAAAKARQGQVLDLMVRHGQVSAAEADAARVEPLTFATSADTTDIRAPHWVFYIQDQLIRRYGEAAVYRGGLRVTTTLDLDLTERGYALIDEKVTEFEKLDCGCRNGALVAIDNNTGQILAMVGSRDFNRKDIQGENNNATALKQPGSAFKPAVYLSAFLKGWTPATVVWDVAKKYPNPGGEPFVPVGPTSRYQGPVTARQALGSSLNAPAVRAAEYASVLSVIDTAHKLGISTLTDPENYGVSIATGGANVTLLDMTYMYSTLANNGVIVGDTPIEPRPRKLDPISLLKVTDGRGRTLYEFREPKREQVVPAAQAYLITNVLSDDSARNLIYSPGLFNLKDARPLAAKTGTQQGYEVSQIRSTWNFGYVPDLSVGVWVGNADGALVRNITSASSSLQIWKEFMQYAVDRLEIKPKPFAVPPGISRARVTVPSGGSCRTIEDDFTRESGVAADGGGATPRPGSTSTPVATACRVARIDTRTGLLATEATPAEFIREVAYLNVPSDVEWSPGDGFRTGLPPVATSVVTATPTPPPTPTRAPTLPPRVVTATADEPPAPAVGTPVAPVLPVPPVAVPGGPPAAIITPVATPSLLPPRAVTAPPSTGP